MSANTADAIDRWHEMMARGTTVGLYDLLAPDCTFWSPVVHTPQRGRDITFLYLSDVHVNGIDLIYLKDNLISEFKVMVRPLKAVNKVHEHMMTMLETMKPSSSGS